MARQATKQLSDSLMESLFNDLFKAADSFSKETEVCCSEMHNSSAMDLKNSQMCIERLYKISHLQSCSYSRKKLSCSSDIA